jgi:ketosteroid isomerase-like protein
MTIPGKKMISHRLVVLTSALFFSACNTESSTTDSDAMESLQARELAFLSAMSEQDAELAPTFFGDDAVLHIANMPPVQGRESIARFYANVFRFQLASTTVPEHLQVSASSDLAYTRGSSNNVFDGADGPIEYAGKYLLVWQRPSHVWEIVVYSLSNNQQAP